MKESDEPSSKALVEITDLLGFAAATTPLLKAIVLGVGNFLSPGQRRRDTRADLEIIGSVSRTLEESGLTATSAELTLENRGVIRFAADNRRHQANREAVALEAIEDFKQLPDATSTQQKTPPLDTEWVDRFWRLAECITDADKQILWGRILSRKVSGAFPIGVRTLEFMGTLSSEEARDLENISRFVYRGVKHDGTIEMGVIRGLGRHQAEPVYTSRDSIKSLNRKLVDMTAFIPFDHFGALGLFIEDGFAQTFALPVMNNAIELSISNLRLRLIGKEQPLVPNNQGDYMTVGSGHAATQLGRDTIGMIVSTPDMEYISVIQELARAYGNELIIAD